MREKTLIVIVGPTAIGKTSLGIDVAKAFNTEILSSDSRQFYKEMSIGTAVPTSEERSAVPHHFIHHKHITEDYSVGDFEKEAIQFIHNYFQKNDILVMVGGSGLYEKAVTQGLDDFPDVAPKFREELNSEIERDGLENLQNELKEKDPDYYDEVDIHNPKRVIRALEIIRGTGKKFSDFRKAKGKQRSFQVIKIGLSLPREKIYNRINQRVDIMMEQGLLQEAQRLYPQRELNALQTVGYRELFAYMDGEYDLNKAIEEIKKNTRRFAKRQLTWYRKDTDVTWFEPTDKNKILAYLVVFHKLCKLKSYSEKF